MASNCVIMNGNPYAPKLARLPYQSIPAQWWTWCPDKRDRRYVLPTPAQMKTLVLVVPWLCGELGIPYEFSTEYLSRKQRKIKGWKIPPRAKPGPGIVAHRDFASHADGRYLLEHLIIQKQFETSEFDSYSQYA